MLAHRLLDLAVEGDRRPAVAVGDHLDLQEVDGREQRRQAEARA